jgi:hypothetical protein
MKKNGKKMPLFLYICSFGVSEYLKKSEIRFLILSQSSKKKKRSSRGFSIYQLKS